MSQSSHLKLLYILNLLQKSIFSCRGESVAVALARNERQHWRIKTLISPINPDANASPFLDLCKRSIEVDTESAPGATQGQTKAVSGLPPNVFVSLNPSFDNLPFSASEVFFYLEPTKSVPEPTSVMSLLTLGAIGIGFQLKRKAQKP